MSNRLIERIDQAISDLADDIVLLEACDDHPDIDVQMESIGVLQDCKAALTQQQEAEPVDAFSVFDAGFRYCATDWADMEDLRSDIGSPAYLHDRDVIFARSSFKPAAQPQVPESIVRTAKEAIDLATDENMPSYPLTAIGMLTEMADFILSLSAAKEES